MKIYKSSRYFSLFTAVLLSFSLILTPFQTTTFAETNEPEVHENEVGEVHNNENDDQLDGTTSGETITSNYEDGEGNREENDDADESLDLGNSEIIDGEVENAGNEENGQQNPSTTNVGEKSVEVESADAELVEFEDENLKSAVAESLGIHGRDVTIEDIKNLGGLDVSNSGITSLKGLEHASRLISLKAAGNNISDISMLEGLTVDGLDLSNNNISDISALKNLTVHYLDLSSNNIQSFDSLAGANNLAFLYLDNNNISSIPNNPGNLLGLANLTLSGNKLTDISNLKGFDYLTYLDLSYNNIKDITILKELDFYQGFGSHKSVLLNGIEITDIDTITALRNKGIEVDYDEDYKEPVHEGETPGNDNGTKDDNTKPGSNDGSGQITPESELEKVFPKDKGYIVSENTVKIVAGNQQTVELSPAQLEVLKKNNRPIVIDRNGVDLIIPSSLFNTDENVEVSVEQLADVDDSFGIFKFTIKQGGKTISEFDEPITLSFEVDVSQANDPNNLKVFYLNEKTGEWELIGGTYQNGVVTVTTDHFSTFAVFEVEQEKSARPNNEDKTQVTVAADQSDGGNKLPATATSTYNLLLLGAVIIAAGVITLIIRPRRVRVKAK